MAIERCPAGHFYNSDKYNSCPHCEGGEGGVSSRKISERDLAKAGVEAEFRTVTAEAAKKYFQEHKDEYQGKATGMSSGTASGDDDDDKTIGYSGAVGAGEPAAGWLVCTEGSLRGRDFTLRSGKNVLCEYPGMSLVSPGAAVVYDPKHNSFLFFAGGAQAEVNGSLILNGTAALKKSDKIKLDGLELTFIPFCEGDFKW